ncbi:MAG: Zn-ribbon domain-containing OB-fold protein, partial [Thermoplasmata archaeon]
MAGIINKDEKTGMPYLNDLRQLDIKYRVPVKYIEKFYAGLEDGKIYATRCPVCGKKYFPPEAWCSSCGYSGEMDFYDMDRNGTLLTFTVVYAKPTSFSKFGNYTVGIMHLEA